SPLPTLALVLPHHSRISAGAPQSGAVSRTCSHAADFAATTGKGGIVMRAPARPDAPASLLHSAQPVRRAPAWTRPTCPTSRIVRLLRQTAYGTTSDRPSHVSRGHECDASRHG